MRVQLERVKFERCQQEVTKKEDPLVNTSVLEVVKITMPQQTPRHFELNSLDSLNRLLDLAEAYVVIARLKSNDKGKL